MGYEVAVRTRRVGAMARYRKKRRQQNSNRQRSYWKTFPGRNECSTVPALYRVETGRLETRTLLVFKTHCVSQWRRDIRLHLQEGRHEDLPRRAHDGWSVKGQSSPSTRQLQCHLESHRPLLCMTGILPTGGRCCRKTETFKTALMTQAPGMPRLGWQEQNQFHEQLTMCLPLKTLVGV